MTDMNLEFKYRIIIIESGLFENQISTDEYLLIKDPLQIKTGFSDLLKIQPDTSKQAIF
jgi:hypothetical protein